MSARLLAAEHLAGALPERWAHVQGVAARAEAIAPIVPQDGELLVAAAWLHDLGYAPTVAQSGFHPLDGARYLRNLGAGARLCGLVAHHSAAQIEAEMWGLDTELSSEFAFERSAVTDSLWYADLVTGPRGETVTVQERLAEIVERYGPDNVVTAAVSHSRPILMDAVHRIGDQLAAAAVSRGRPWGRE